MEADPSAMNEETHPAHSTANTAPMVINANQPSFPFNFQFPPTHTPFQATEQHYTPPFPSPVRYPPPYMNLTHSPIHNIPTMGAGFPLDPFGSYALQTGSRPLRLLAPKPPQDNKATETAGRTLGHPPDFIDTVKAIRHQLYQKAKLRPSDEPHIVDAKTITEWRQSVIDARKPVSLSLFSYFHARSQYDFSTEYCLCELLLCGVFQLHAE